MGRDFYVYIGSLLPRSLLPHERVIGMCIGRVCISGGVHRWMVV